MSTSGQRPPRAEPAPTAARGWEAVCSSTRLAGDLLGNDSLRALRIAGEALDALLMIDEAEWDERAVDALSTLAHAHHRAGVAAESVTLLFRALGLLERPHVRAAVGTAGAHRLLTRLGEAHLRAGLYAAALEHAYAAVDLAETINRPAPLAWTWSLLAWTHLDLGELDDARAACELSVAHSACLGVDSTRRATAAMPAVLVASRQGDLVAARRHADTCLAGVDLLSVGDQAGVHLVVGQLDFRAGRPDAARAHLEEAQRLGKKAGERFSIFAALSWLACIELAAGRPRAALETMEQALGTDQPSMGLVAPCYRTVALAYEAMGELGPALEWQRRFQRAERTALEARAGERVRLLELRQRTAMIERQSELDRARAEQADDERRADAERYRTMIESAADLVSVLDEDSSIRWISAAVEPMLGTPTAEIVGRRPFDAFPHEDTRVPGQAFLAALAQPGIPSTPVEYRVRHRDGSWRYLSAVMTDLRHDPTVAGVLYVATDITQRRWHGRLMAAQATVLDMILRGMPVTHTLDHLVDTVSDLSGASVSCRVLDPTGNGQGSSLLVEMAAGREPTDEERQLIEQFSQLATLAVDHSRAAELVAHQATHDFLTGLPNRLRFERVITEALVDRAHDGPPLAVLFIDLDRFKVVNDSLGHGTGDRLLVQVAERLTSRLEAGDVVARFGGDEFTILRPEVSDAAQLVAFARSVVTAVEAPFVVDAMELSLSASVGVTVCRRSATEASTLIAEADSAMLRAKELGRNRVELFDDDLRRTMEGRLRLETALRRSIGSDELLVLYQPQVELATGRVCGHEALVRWRSEDLGTVDPADFIAVAEETGLVIALGDQVIRAACEQLAAHPDRAPIWVNLSANQLVHPNLADTVASTLAANGVEPGSLCFEITETTIGSDVGPALDGLAALRATGARIAIDDFGTGYSSLDRLQTLPIDVLKLDRSFVVDVDRSPPRRALLKAILDLAGSLAMVSVAEGVETADELACLVDNGCDAAQGYLFARPGPLGALPRRYDMASFTR